MASSHQRRSKKRCSWKFLKIHRNCFSVNFEKFLRTPFLQNTSRWLLLDRGSRKLSLDYQDLTYTSLMYIRITSVSENWQLLHYVPNLIFSKVDLIFAVSLVLRLTNFFRKVSDKSRNKSEVNFKVPEHSSSSNSKFCCRSSFCIFVLWSILAYSQKLTLIRFVL